ncbi:uncharacterized protein M6B38_345745 [Iris pallida]|uniref:DEUBAD domain-containing protein n=1 Tax=Iris pallida TaxID=29817 RepID=A0AAX6GV17_IRIPA|nr:uncharacterized protein M6B38_345745 [Iris pallida]
MAAGQQKKISKLRLHEHHKGKKRKKVDSSDYVLNLTPRIHLEWDNLQNTVVAKREQIGIAWSDMASFLEFLPKSRNGLVDVLLVPKEIFGLNDLMDVLSYEVWATCLSESERKLLTQFLPDGTGAEQTVHSLLTGENHHFGNPFIKWSTSLSSGNLHPDYVLRKEWKMRTAKKNYYSELNKYHTDMLEDLMNWKERCSSCKDPEKLWSKRIAKHKQGTLSICKEKTKVSSLPKKEVSNKTFIRNGDITKYMSYIKISKKQHEAIKNLRHSGDGIQTKSLTCILGDIKGLHIHPLEALLEEEKTRLHEHWLQIVNEDLPVAFEAQQKDKLQRKQLKKCLDQEFTEKRALILDKAETDDQESSPRKQIEDGNLEYEPETIIKDVISAPAGSSHCHHMTHIPSLNSYQEPSATASDHIVAGNDSLSSACSYPAISQFNGKIDLMECDREPKSSSLPSRGIWNSVDSKGWAFYNDPSQRLCQPTEECRAPMIDLERGYMEQGAGEPDCASLFSTYATQRQDNFLAPFPKGLELLSSYAPHQHISHVKQPELKFVMANEHLSEPSQFPYQLQDQQSLVEHTREKELYTNQMMNRSIYSNGLSYPNQEIYPSEIGGNLVEHTLLTGNLQTYNNYWYGGMSSSSGPQWLGGNTDGSLSSVLSGCRNVPSGSIYDTRGSGQSMGTRNLVPNNSNAYGFIPHQFETASSQEATVPASSTLNIPWLNYPSHQNSSLQDSMGKPYSRSRN